LRSRDTKSKKIKQKSNNQSSNIEFELDLLQRHIAMLKAIVDNEPIGIIRLSEMLEIPQHKVRYSMRILEQEGLIEPSLEGAVTTDRLKDFLKRLTGALGEISRSVTDIEKSVR
jgi:predicted transcriptional regulator